MCEVDPRRRHGAEPFAHPTGSSSSESELSAIAARMSASDTNFELGDAKPAIDERLNNNSIMYRITREVGLIS